MMAPMKLLKLRSIHDPPRPSPVAESAQFAVKAEDLSQAAVILLILRAFSSGCSALTGVEAVANRTATCLGEFEPVLIELLARPVQLVHEGESGLVHLGIVKEGLAGRVNIRQLLGEGEPVDGGQPCQQ